MSKQVLVVCILGERQSGLDNQEIIFRGLFLWCLKNFSWCGPLDFPVLLTSYWSVSSWFQPHPPPSPSQTLLSSVELTCLDLQTSPPTQWLLTLLMPWTLGLGAELRSLLFPIVTPRPLLLLCLVKPFLLWCLCLQVSLPLPPLHRYHLLTSWSLCFITDEWDSWPHLATLGY